MVRKTSLVLLGAAVGAGLTVLVTQPPQWIGASARAAASDTYRQLNLFGDIFERVRSHYVEKPDDSKLVEGAVNGMLNGLDPHSSYLDPKNFRDMQIQTRGEFGGLGIEVTMEDGLVKVVAPIDDTPAAKAGIRAGDIITALDDDPVQGLTLNQAVDKMRGPVNTKINLKVMRKGLDKPLDIAITRDIIRVRSVRWKTEDDVGYIRITQFNDQTTEGLKKAIKEITEQVPADKLKGFVLDLRNNPGGLLDQAISVSDAFLERGEIVSTRGRDPEETQRFSAHAGDLVRGKPVIVLINGGSASASEIVAGALQDHKRATLLGTRSFGKGSVQTIIPLGPGNGALLHAGRSVDPGQGHRAGHRSVAGGAGRGGGARVRRDQGRGIAARPSQSRRRRGAGWLTVLCPDRCREGQGAERGLQAAAWDLGQRGLPAQFGESLRGSELIIEDTSGGHWPPLLFLYFTQRSASNRIVATCCLEVSGLHATL
jgi:carboxyl-terminal processing protease